MTNVTPFGPVTRELDAEDIAFGPLSRPASEAVHELNHPGEPLTSHVARSFYSALSALRQTAIREQDAPRLQTGYSTIDRATRGLQPGELFCILGRPACLKTQHSLAMVESMLRQRPASAFLLVNLEMPAVQLVMRQARMHFRLTEAAIEDGLRRDVLDVEGFSRKHQNQYLYDHGLVSLSQIERVAIDLQRQLGDTPLDAIVIDHLSLVRAERGASAYERMSATAAGAKQLARTLNCVVIALVQANRGAKNDSDPVPLEGARDSGAVEECADFLLTLGQLIEGAASSRRPYIKGRLAKNRRGATVSVAFTFDPLSMRMGELDRDCE